MFLVVMVVLLAAGSAIHSIGSDGAEAAPVTTEWPVNTPVETEAAPTATVEPQEIPWSDEDVRDMTLTLAGECYDDKEADKRLVCEVILNRVSAGLWGDTIHDVVSSPYQFSGYWSQSRAVSASDIEIATQALADWYANDCEALSEYLYFTAGPNRENSFRAEY